MKIINSENFKIFLLLKSQNNNSVDEQQKLFKIYQFEIYVSNFVDFLVCENKKKKVNTMTVTNGRVKHTNLQQPIRDSKEEF